MYGEADRFRFPPREAFMDIPAPTINGQVIEYAAVLPPNSVPRIYTAAGGGSVVDLNTK
jgi:hypothetical protein